MANDTIRAEDLVTMVAPRLEELAAQGAKNQDTAEKIARMLLWARAKTKEYTIARDMLVTGHAKKDKDGNTLPVRQKNPETGEMESVPNQVQIEDAEAFLKASAALNDTEYGTSGVKLTRDDLPEDTKPNVYADLGPLYDWGAGIEEPEKK